MATGEVFNGTLALSNYGLVRADNLTVKLPTNDVFLRYDFLSDIPTSLAAHQRLSIPYRVVALKSLDPSAALATATGGGCYNYSNSLLVQFSSTCANGDTAPGQASASFMAGSDSTCGPNGGGAGGGPGGGISDGGGSGSAGGQGTPIFRDGGAGSPTTTLPIGGKHCVFIPLGNNPSGNNPSNCTGQ
jgi:hypothetical protein